MCDVIHTEQNLQVYLEQSFTVPQEQDHGFGGGRSLSVAVAGRAAHSAPGP
jgi:hypothetical protein